jgi:hypothetical protein
MGMFDNVVLNALGVIIGIALIWITVRVAGNAWFTAKKAHTDSLLRELEDLERRKESNGEKQKR